MALVLDELLDEAPVTWFLSYKGAPLLPPMRLMELITDFPQEMPAERQRATRSGETENKPTAWQRPATLLAVTVGTVFYAKTSGLQGKTDFVRQTSHPQATFCLTAALASSQPAPTLCSERDPQDC